MHGMIYSFFPIPNTLHIYIVNNEYEIFASIKLLQKKKKMITMLFLKAWEGVGVVSSARKLIGSTDPLQANPGTIRGDLAVQTGR